MHPLPVRFREDGIDALCNIAAEDIGCQDEAKLQQCGIDTGELGVPLTLAGFPIDEVVVEAYFAIQCGLDGGEHPLDTRHRGSTLEPSVVDTDTKCGDCVAGCGDAGDACLPSGAKRVVGPVQCETGCGVTGIQKEAKGADCHVIGIS